jgi:hypothetical protein
MRKLKVREAILLRRAGVIAKVAKPPKYAAIRRVALALPGAREELTHHGYWFNVGKKTFALYWGKDARWIFKLPRDRQEILFEVRPETFAPMKAGRLVWSYVRVEDLDGRELKDLLTAAWSTVVPKRSLAK